MSKLVSINTCSENPWTRIESADTRPSSLEFALLPLDIALSQSSFTANTGVWLSSDQNALDLAPIIDKVSAVALNVESFMDGRNFSQARILRDELQFKGNIISTGTFIFDQLHYLTRCGVNQFDVDESTDIAAIQALMTSLTESYQASSDEPRPLFRRRAH